MPALVDWTLRDGWWTADDGVALEAFEPTSGRRVSATGALREALVDRERLEPMRPWLRTVAEDALAFADALSRSTSRPLTRADVLRGGGYGQLFVELTGRCNERCTHCYADASPERTEELSFEAVAAALDDAVALGFPVVQFTGGDPLLHRGLVDLVAYARAIGMPRIEIFTNGLALGEPLLDRLAPHGVEFAFSVYSHDPGAHDAVTRVEGSHARTLRAIERCLARGLRVRVGVTLMPETQDHGPAVTALLLERGLAPDAIRLGSSRSVGRGIAHDPESDGNHGATRGGADGKACVSSNGDVYPCIFMRGHRLGNVGERSLRAILEDPSPIRALPGLDPRLASARERLSCGECRWRDALLDAPEPTASLVALRSRPS